MADSWKPGCIDRQNPQDLTFSFPAFCRGTRIAILSDGYGWLDLFTTVAAPGCYDMKINFVPILYQDPAVDAFDDIYDFVESTTSRSSKSCQVSNPCRGASRVTWTSCEERP